MMNNEPYPWEDKELPATASNDMAQVTPIPTGATSHEIWPGKQDVVDNDNAPDTTDSLSPSDMTNPDHHPAIQTMLDRALHGTDSAAKNLAILVGTIQIDTNKGGKHRQITTAIGDLQLRYYLAINEELAGESGASRVTYRLQLSISRSLVERYTNLLVEGQRIQLFGTVKREQQYDRRLARDADDPGQRTWAVQFEVIDLQPAPIDTPDYSHIVIEGEIAGDPVPRRHFLDRDVYEYFASAMIRNRLRVQSAAPGSRATYPVTHLLPLQVPLDEPLDNLGAVLKKGCTVRIEGRLMPYVVRRNPAHNPRLQAALAERDAHWEKEWLRNDVRWTILVGYVERLNGTPLDEATVLSLREAADTQAGQRRQRAKSPEQSVPDEATVIEAIDEATKVVLDQLEPDVPAPVDPLLPRRQPRPYATTGAPFGTEDSDDNA